LARFLVWARANDPGFAHLAALERAVAAARPVKRRRGPSGPPWRSLGRRVSGAPLGWGPLLCEPTNELGVAVAFGALAEALGYAVESTTPAFPDCLCRRRVAGGRWEPVKAELEFRASNFFAHGHDPAGCDVIVCWENDWPDCPIEVLDLKGAIERLRRRAAGPVHARPRMRNGELGRRKERNANAGNRTRPGESRGDRPSRQRRRRGPV
jgi:hypothetical protein